MSDDAIAQEWYDRKSAKMTRILGAQHDTVMHSVIPYEMGGALDLYYFPSGIQGTAIATKELSGMPGEGSSNSLFDTYELVMFTRHPLSLNEANDQSTPFGRTHHSINAILNRIARYSAEAKLNPNATCEFPKNMKIVGDKCLIFDSYGSDGTHEEFGLLAIIEIHRSEMDFARKHGGGKLLEKLRQAGCYPYSDLDRKAVM